MIYIWLDESDKKGEYFSYFYGGILIESQHINDVMAIMKRCTDDAGLTGHEIKGKGE